MTFRKPFSILLCWDEYGFLILKSKARLIILNAIQPLEIKLLYGSKSSCLIAMGPVKSPKIIKFAKCNNHDSLWNGSMEFTEFNIFKQLFQLEGSQEDSTITLESGKYYSYLNATLGKKWCASYRLAPIPLS